MPSHHNPKHRTATATTPSKIVRAGHFSARGCRCFRACFSGSLWPWWSRSSVRLPRETPRRHSWSASDDIMVSHSRDEAHGFASAGSSGKRATRNRPNPCRTREEAEGLLCARDLARQEAPKGQGGRPEAPALRVAAGCLLDVWQLVVHAAAEECCHALHPHRKECEVGAWYASASSRHDMQLLAHTVSKAT